VVAQYADEIQRRAIRLELSVEPITLFIDSDGLSLALRNLLENALKYTRDQIEPAIVVKSNALPHSVLLTLQDNGIGFDMQYHDHIFKLFQRLHRDDQYPGTGIGLALVRKAIERLGAKKDGVIRHHQARRDGSPRDSVMYSVLAAEWPDVKRHLVLRLARHEDAT